MTSQEIAINLGMAKRISNVKMGMHPASINCRSGYALLLSISTLSIKRTLPSLTAANTRIEFVQLHAGIIHPDLMLSNYHARKKVPGKF